MAQETYPRYTFSVRRDGYNSILIRLMKADFEAFTRESGKVQGDINHYQHPGIGQSDRPGQGRDDKRQGFCDVIQFR